MPYNKVCEKRKYALWKHKSLNRSFITYKGEWICGGKRYLMNIEFINLTSKGA